MAVEPINQTTSENVDQIERLLGIERTADSPMFGIERDGLSFEYTAGDDEAIVRVTYVGKVDVITGGKLVALTHREWS